MSEAIRFQLNHVSANGSITYSYFRTPYRCTFRNLIATIQGDPGDADTIAVTDSDTNELGVLTFGSTLTAGDGGTWVADSTYGDHVIASGELLTFTMSAGDAIANILLNIELDPFARAV